ncbi:hypothetical protein VW23_006190 [Devosia insulae DS-56]|uniref:Uncharacterized protein n=1 Tax=Devosia insulae DS-56 TaxID=1116389 RepID=A0A1E5XHS3_9HYPH|nr:hypothetical protein [Devosia insulae]OEO28151.1 hypothetical protein VW23_006190 [Devosia insulae DS-56]
MLNVINRVEGLADKFSDYKGIVDEFEDYFDKGDKRYLEGKLKGLAKDFGLDVIKAGTKLAISRIFGGDQAGTQEVQQVSEMASDVIYTWPSFSGIKERIDTIKGGLTGFVTDKLNEVKEGFDNIKAGPQ